MQNKPGAVVQLVRISACHAGGRGFESRPHREKSSKRNSLLFYISRDLNPRPKIKLSRGLSLRVSASSSPVRTANIKRVSQSETLFSFIFHRDLNPQPKIKLSRGLSLRVSLIIYSIIV